MKRHCWTLIGYEETLAGSMKKLQLDSKSIAAPCYYNLNWLLKMKKKIKTGKNRF